MTKATLIGCSVFFGVLFAAPSAKAQSCYQMPPQAPDMCSPGYYAQNYNGAWYGPNYYVYPSFQPFQGMVPGPTQGSGGPGGPAGPGGAPGYPGMGGNGMGGNGMAGPARFPTHPFARSPRDYFMYDGK